MSEKNGIYMLIDRKSKEILEVFSNITSISKSVKKYEVNKPDGFYTALEGVIKTSDGKIPVLDVISSELENVFITRVDFGNVNKDQRMRKLIFDGFEPEYEPSIDQEIRLSCYEEYLKKKGVI